MNDTLGREIVSMAEVDQRMRRAGAEGGQWDREVDLANTRRMRVIVDEIRWPTKSAVGEHAEHMAWLLVQHADSDRAFQIRCLELMRAEDAVQVCPKHIAYLDDRTRVSAGMPQLYGTQLQSGPNGVWEPLPVEEPDRIDERRAAVGLEPLSEYLRMANAQRR